MSFGEPYFLGSPENRAMKTPTEKTEGHALRGMHFEEDSEAF